ncbi:hypothetical protein [Kitasatospora sp. NPDC090091]|uniref:hypothetical protein n=1 Tax=Kitasatospora sp. NPDC090091 TaxID=3364081 RepID=UPI0037F577EE
MTARRDQLPGGLADIGRTIDRLRRSTGERAAQLLPYLRRTDTSVALSLGTAWQLYDKAGHPVVAEDAIAGQGLALPYLSMLWAPARYTDWLATTSGTFEDIHRATIYKLQPYASVSIGHTTDVSGTTGELQVTVAGRVIGSPTAVAFSQAAVTIGPFALTGDFKQQIELRVQARRTAGTGNVRVAVLASTGLQS